MDACGEAWASALDLFGGIHEGPTADLLMEHPCKAGSAGVGSGEHQPPGEVQWALLACVIQELDAGVARIQIDGSYSTKRLQTCRTGSGQVTGWWGICRRIWTLSRNTPKASLRASR
ncbi:hypothetical protein MAR_001126 [Mya arenaria]|uniref:Uncharacterized protein n=1 Tax=Mya arenaria TaxID=6604 RepID=A0ABY7FAT6_MYAAR|nr:hypothetical protein MAR_001126 [Mya arenaria]